MPFVWRCTATPGLSEDDSSAPNWIARLVSELHERGLFAGVAAVTLGRHGVVLADTFHRKCWQLVTDGPPVATTSGAGDRWLAAWIYYRDVLGIEDPTAAARANRHVAEWLGMRDATVQVAELPLEGSEFAAGM